MALRLSRVEGQIRGIARMIEADVYCDDVLNQMASVSAALNGAKKVLLEAHLKSCVLDQIQKGKTGVMDELIITLSKIMKSGG